jgi:hypothetical protein
MASKRQVVFTVLVVFFVGAVSLYYLHQSKESFEAQSRLQQIKQMATATTDPEGKQVAMVLLPLLNKQMDCEGCEKARKLNDAELQQIQTYYAARKPVGIHKVSTGVDVKDPVSVRFFLEQLEIKRKNPQLQVPEPTISLEDDIAALEHLDTLSSKYIQMYESGATGVERSDRLYQEAKSTKQMIPIALNRYKTNPNEEVKPLFYVQNLEQIERFQKAIVEPFTNYPF